MAYQPHVLENPVDVRNEPQQDTHSQAIFLQISRSTHVSVYWHLRCLYKAFEKRYVTEGRPYR